MSPLYFISRNSQIILVVFRCNKTYSLCFWKNILTRIIIIRMIEGQTPLNKVLVLINHVVAWIKDTFFEKLPSHKVFN